MRELIPHVEGVSPGLGQLNEQIFVTSACCGFVLELELSTHLDQYRCTSCGLTAPVGFDDDGDILRPDYHLSWTRARCGEVTFALWLEDWFPELVGCEVSVDF